MVHSIRHLYIILCVYTHENKKRIDYINNLYNYIYIWFSEGGDIQHTMNVKVHLWAPIYLWKRLWGILTHAYSSMRSIISTEHKQSKLTLMCILWHCNHQKSRSKPWIIHGKQIWLGMAGPARTWTSWVPIWERLCQHGKFQHDIQLFCHPQQCNHC